MHKHSFLNEKKWVLVGLFLNSAFLLFNANAWGGWSQRAVLRPLDSFQSTLLGDGRNDGRTHIYLSNNSFLFEYTLDSNYVPNLMWIEPLIVGSGSSLFASSLLIGDGRNDGINRIYIPDYATIAEFTWQTSIGKYDRRDVEDSNFKTYAITLGNGRNDGVNRLYAISGEVLRPSGSGPNYIFEYTFTGGSWNRSAVSTDSGYFDTIVLANGRNDGVNRIYSFDASYIYEYTYSAGAWEKQSLALEEWNIRAVVIGDGRNDGVERVYACSGYRSGRYGYDLYEYTYSGGIWNEVKVGEFDGWPSWIKIIDDRNDGVKRINVYSDMHHLTGNDYTGHVSEFSYADNTWQMKTWGRTSVYSIDFGTGLNDGVGRFYFTGKSNTLTSYTGYSLTEKTWNPNLFETWGYIRDDRNDVYQTNGLAAVSIKLLNKSTGEIFESLSSDDGYYEFTNIASGTYQLIPSKFGWIFTPSAQEINPANLDQMNLKFVGVISFPYHLPFNDQLKNGSAQPNPFLPATGQKCMFMLDDTSRSANYKISILNMQGAVVRTLYNENIWDGRNDSGRLCEGGAYIYQVQSQNHRTNGQVILVK